jgi:hypothetical protein
MPTARILLRSDTPAIDENGVAVLDGDGRRQMITATYDDVHLDRLSPRARALAEAIAGTPLATATTVWVEADRPIRDTMPEESWRPWYTEEQAALPERRPWSAWDRYRATDPTDPHDWLERQAVKIPAGWHVLGAHPATPVATTDTGMTTDQVLATLARRGIRIKAATWRAYVARGYAPPPARRTGRTPLWDPAGVIAFAAAWSGRPERE